MAFELPLFQPEEDPSANLDPSLGSVTPEEASSSVDLGLGAVAAEEPISAPDLNLTPEPDSATGATVDLGITATESSTASDVALDLTPEGTPQKPLVYWADILNKPPCVDDCEALRLAIVAQLKVIGVSDTTTIDLDIINGVIVGTVKDSSLGLDKLAPTQSGGVLGNLQGGAVTIIPVLDEDDFRTNSDTALATQQSIKAYVDSKFGPSTRQEGLVYAADLGNGVARIFSVSHGLDSSDVHVQLRRKATGDIVYATTKVVDSNTISVTFATAPSLAEYRVTVKK